jgi:hypothetical protein
VRFQVLTASMMFRIVFWDVLSTIILRGSTSQKTILNEEILNYTLFYSIDEFVMFTTHNVYKVFLSLYTINRYCNLSTVQGYYIRSIHSFAGAYSPGWTIGLPFRGFLITHIQIHGRTPLDELSARRRDLYLHRTTQHIDTTDKHPCPIHF